MFRHQCAYSYQGHFDSLSFMHYTLLFLPFFLYLSTLRPTRRRNTLPDRWTSRCSRHRRWNRRHHRRSRQENQREKSKYHHRWRRSHWQCTRSTRRPQCSGRTIQSRRHWIRFHPKNLRKVICGLLGKNLGRFIIDLRSSTRKS